MRYFVAVLVIVASLAYVAAQDAPKLANRSDPILVAAKDAAAALKTGDTPVFAPDSGSYVVCAASETGKERMMMWLNRGSAEPVKTDSGKLWTGLYVRLKENGSHVFATCQHDGGLRAIYLLVKGIASAITDTKGNILTSSDGLNDFAVYGPAPEYVQVGEKNKFFSLKGSTCTSISLPEIQPELHRPQLMLTPHGTYLLDRKIPTNKGPGRLWLLDDKGGLKRVTWGKGDDADMGSSLFYHTSDATFALIRNKLELDDEDAEWFVWELTGSSLFWIEDEEGDPMQAATLGGQAVAGDSFYVPGWVRESDEMHLRRVSSKGQPTLVQAAGKPLKGAEVSSFSTRDALLIRCLETEESEEPSLWLCRGDRAEKIVDEKKQPLRGIAFAKSNGAEILLTLENVSRTCQLFRIDSKCVARPVKYGENTISGKGPRFSLGVKLSFADGGLHSIAYSDEKTATYYFHPAAE